MYLEYFSLKRHPFRITPDPSLFFPGGAHGRGVVLDALVYGITTGEGILKVVGEVGSGKTMLCRMLEEKLPRSVEIVYLANPSLSARDIIYAIAFELKLDVDSATDRLVVMHKLQDYLLKRHAEGASIVVFIEEAQSMPLESLEEIRLLSNLETHRHKLMQIVLFGQPELDRKLESRDIRQLRERITHSFYLQPLGPEEVREYLHFRLQSAGCPWPQLFSPKAEKLIAAASGGLTRRINILADKALLASYADPLIRPEPRNSAGEVQSMVLPRHVRVAIADSGYGGFSWTSLIPWGGYVLAAVTLLALVFVLLSGPAEQAPEPESAVVAVQEPVAIPQELVATPQEPVAVQQESVAIPVVEPVASSAPVEPLPAAVLPAEPQEATPAAAVTQQPQTVVASTPAPALPEEVAAQSSPPRVEAPAPEVLPASQPVLVAELNVPTPEPAPAQAEPEAIPEPKPPVEQTAPERVTRNRVSLPTTGLAGKRVQPSREWLDSLASKSGYTLQLFALPAGDTVVLEEVLEFLELTDMLESSYLCIISANARRPEQWLLMHGEFAGLSEARRFTDSLPPYLRQYQPYVRNLSDIACAQ